MQNSEFISFSFSRKKKYSQTTNLRLLPAEVLHESELAEAADDEACLDRASVDLRLVFLPFDCPRSCVFGPALSL